MQKSSTA